MMNLHAGGPQGQMSQRACGFLARLRQAELQVWRKPGSGAAGAKEVRENWCRPFGDSVLFLARTRHCRAGLSCAAASRLECFRLVSPVPFESAFLTQTIKTSGKVTPRS